MKVGILLGVATGAIATYACMADSKFEKMIKKMTKKVKNKYKEMMD